MESLQKDLRSIVKDLRALTLTTERLSRRLSELESVAAPATKSERIREAKSTKEPSRAGKTGKPSAAERVFGIIQKSGKGADMTRLKAKTGFGDRKIWNAIYQLKKIGKVKNTGRGIYVSI